VVIVFEQALAVVRFEHLRNERPDVINMGTASIKSFVVCEGVPQKLVNENSGQIVDVFVFVVRFDRLDDPVALGRNLTITLTTAQLLIDKRIDDAADRVPLPAFLFYEASAGSRPRRPAQLHEDYTALARATLKTRGLPAEKQTHCRELSVQKIALLVERPRSFGCFSESQCGNHPFGKPSQTLPLFSQKLYHIRNLSQIPASMQLPPQHQL
jgi:hypothetical protein